MAKKYGRNVVYTKIDAPDFMRGVAQSGGEEQFVLHFDGVGALLRLLVYLSESCTAALEADGGGGTVLYHE